MENKILWTPLSIETEMVSIKDEENATIDLPFSIGVYNTIIGPIDMNSGHHILDHFNIWIIDTNFALNKKLLTTLSQLDGVELIKPISKYKCAIGLGKMFDQNKIRINIENALTGKHKNYLELLKLDEPTRSNAIDIFNKISKFPYWLIYIFPNGSIEKFSSTDEEEYLNKLEEFQNYYKLSKGLLLHE